VVALATAFAVAAAGVGGGQADSAAHELTPAQLAGQRVVAGFGGTRPPQDLLRRIRQGRVGGVILFGGNFASRRQLRRTVNRLQDVPRPAAVDEPLLVMVDQEGGPVRRLPGAPESSAAEIGATGRRSVARRAGREAALNLRSVGANVNLAPVVDVARRGSAIERERRAYGRRPGKVARFAGAFAAGLRAERVLPSLKHFPGFGSAGANTDDARVRIRTSRRRLREVDERPYRALFGRGVRLVMLSTAVYTSLDPRWPASLSRRIATRELRERLGFDGVSMTDALGTPATAPHGSAARVGVRAARAGVDLMVYQYAHDGQAAARAMTRAIRRGHIPPSRARDAVERVLELRRGLR
jgi:beta-N-acetylhexosaminidase